MKNIISNSLGPRWYALFVRPRHEKAVATMLMHKGFMIFLPLFSFSRQWGRRPAEVLLPMFPCYVFCRFDVSVQRVAVLGTAGVARIVGFGRNATPVEDSEIAAIRRVVEAGVASEPWPYSNRGQTVRITKGALAGVEGTLMKLKNQHRLILSIKMLQRSVAVEIESSCVESTRLAVPGHSAACVSWGQAIRHAQPQADVQHSPNVPAIAIKEPF
jgi:transcription antitermination factor NusG